MHLGDCLQHERTCVIASNLQSVEIEHLTASLQSVVPGSQSILVASQTQIALPRLCSCPVWDFETLMQSLVRSLQHAVERRADFQTSLPPTERPLDRVQACSSRRRVLFCP